MKNVLRSILCPWKHWHLRRRYYLFRKKCDDGGASIDQYFRDCRPWMIRTYPTLTFEEARDLVLTQANGTGYWKDRKDQTR